MRVRALRVMGTGRLPELTLLKGHKYHLFLSRALASALRLVPGLLLRLGLSSVSPSHRACADVWSTGQDAVATIKRQLQLLLYG
eukprot:1207767-Prymnesium_polylepis.1